VRGSCRSNAPKVVFRASWVICNNIMQSVGAVLTINGYLL
jgi:hypothetical protein